MKLLVCCAVLVLSFAGVKAQKISFSEKKSSIHTYIKGDNFEGVVFSKDFVFPFISDVKDNRRFTPSGADIEAAEKILLKNIKSANRKRINQGGEQGPVIDENLCNYVRQYYGYVTDEGEKVVYISCLNKGNYTTSSKEIPNWLKGVVVVLNGGSNYWQIQANLNKSTLFGLGINDLDRRPSN